MPIETKPATVTPETKILTGEEARAAIIDGIERKLGKRIDPASVIITDTAIYPPLKLVTERVEISVAILPKRRAGRPKKAPPTPATPAS